MARLRIFDVDEAIATATDLFWRKGYDATSLADLTGAMGITPPSFYHAFGSKEGLFDRVLERYQATRLNYAEAALEEPTARRVVEQMLTRLADLYSDPSCPPGCLAVNNALPASADAIVTRRELKTFRDIRRSMLRDRFARAQAEGDLTANCDVAALADFIQVVGWGLAFAAQSGATREELHAAVQRALAAWPH